jgi:multiple sugar transport system substrate-binding protein
VAADYSSKTKSFWDDLISRFEAKYPGEKVNLNLISWDDIEQKVETLVSTHQQPDILNLDAYSNFAADNLLAPVKDVVSPQLEKEFIPAFARNGVVKGQQYGIPFDASVRAFFYNKTAFAQAGIKSPPTTWQQLEADAETIKQKTSFIPYGMDMGPEESEAEFSLWAMGNGGGWVHGNKWAIDQPANVQALQFMNQMAKKGLTNPDPGTANQTPVWQAFAQGKIAMMEGSDVLPSMIQQYDPKMKYGISAVPVNAGHKPVTLGVEDYLMVFNTTKHAGVDKNFIDFFYQPKNYIHWVINEGLLPTTTATAKVTETRIPAFRPYLKLAPFAQFYPATNPVWGGVVGQVKSNLGAALQGQSPQSVLSGLQSAAQSAAQRTG